MSRTTFAIAWRQSTTTNSEEFRLFSISLDSLKLHPIDRSTPPNHPDLLSTLPTNRAEPVSTAPTSNTSQTIRLRSLIKSRMSRKTIVKSLPWTTSRQDSKPLCRKGWKRAFNSIKIVTGKKISVLTRSSKQLNSSDLGRRPKILFLLSLQTKK